MKKTNVCSDEADKIFMGRALALADRALALGEVPIGAVVVWDGSVVGEGYNRRETDKNALLHAEIIAIQEACRRLGGWRLHKATLYVTVEPCMMCAGAIVNARVARVVFGAYDRRFGAFGGRFDANALGLNHRPQVQGGLMEEEASRRMRCFFEDLRHRGSDGKETGERPILRMEKTENPETSQTPEASATSGTSEMPGTSETTGTSGNPGGSPIPPTPEKTGTTGAAGDAGKKETTDGETK